MLTTFDLDQYVYNAMRMGASGFLLKDKGPEQLADAVRVVAAGDTLLAPAITRRSVEPYVSRPPPGARRPERMAMLTQRELDILRLIARGKSNAETAAHLFLSETTVKTHITHLFTKLALRDRTQPVVLAYETGLIQPGDERQATGLGPETPLVKLHRQWVAGVGRWLELLAPRRGQRLATRCSAGPARPSGRASAPTAAGPIATY